MPETMRRSALLKCGAAIGVGAIVPSGLAFGAKYGTTEDWIAGTLVHLISPTEAIVRPAATNSAKRVVLAENANVVHALVGVVNDLSAFLPQEDVMFRVLSRGNDGRWTVQEFQSLYTSVAMEVISASDDSLETTAGRLSLSRWTEPLRQTRVRPGQAYKATVWTNPRTGGRIAMVVDPA